MQGGGGRRKRGGGGGRCPEGLTLVTAAVDLMSTWEAPQRHWSAYLDGVRYLLALRCRLVVFVDAAKLPLLEVLSLLALLVQKDRY